MKGEDSFPQQFEGTKNISFLVAILSNYLQFSGDLVGSVDYSVLDVVFNQSYLLCTCHSKPTLFTQKVGEGGIITPPKSVIYMKSSPSVLMLLSCTSKTELSQVFKKYPRYLGRFASKLIGISLV